MGKQKLLWYCAAAFAVLGACAFGARGLRFSGALCWAICLALIVFAALERARANAPWAKWAELALLALVIAGTVFFAVMEARVIRGRENGAGESAASCVIVLGAGVDGTVPSMSLKCRLDAALDYIADKPDIPVIVSGEQGVGEDISEAECMYRYLTAHGVDPSRVWREEQASSTWTNLTYSLAMMRERGMDTQAPIAIATSDYHSARARFLAQRAGFAAEQVAIVSGSLPEGAYYRLLTVNYYVREAFALANEMLFRVDLDI